MCENAQNRKLRKLQHISENNSDYGLQNIHNAWQFMYKMICYICSKEDDMDILEGFESYSRSGRYYQARISISSSGWISINSTAYKELKLDNYKFAEFYYNRASEMIGIKFTYTEHEGMYEMKPRPVKDDEKALYMSVKGFVQSYGIVKQNETKKYKISKKELVATDLIVVLEPILNKEKKEAEKTEETES